MKRTSLAVMLVLSLAACHKSEEAKPTDDKAATADTKDKKKVILKTDGGHTITLEDKQKNTEEKKVVVKTDGGHTITMDDKQKKMILTSGGGLTITMDDNQTSIEVKGGGRAVTMQGGKLTIT